MAGCPLKACGLSSESQTSPFPRAPCFPVWSEDEALRMKCELTCCRLCLSFPDLSPDSPLGTLPALFIRVGLALTGLDREGRGSVGKK